MDPLLTFLNDGLPHVNLDTLFSGTQSNLEHLSHRDPGDRDDSV